MSSSSPSLLSMVPSLSTLFRIFGTISILSVSSLASLLYLFQRKLIYPSSIPQGARSDKTDPSLWELPFEDLRLKTPDGETLQAWFIRPDDPKQVRRITIVMFQANAGNIAHRLSLASIFYNALSVNVFMLSYRGYGLSTGSPSEEGIKIDAQVAVDWLKARLWSLRSQGLPAPLVVLYGQSLGGAVAIDAAVRNPHFVKGLIVENTFLDIPSLIPSVLPPARFFTWLCTEIWSSRTTLPRLDTRVKALFLSGKKDELVPPSHMRELYTLCRHEEAKDKDWAAFPTGTHNDTWERTDYVRTIALFLRRHFSHVTPLTEAPWRRGFDEWSDYFESEACEACKVNSKRITDDRIIALLPRRKKAVWESSSSSSDDSDERERQVRALNEKILRRRDEPAKDITDDDDDRIVGYLPRRKKAVWEESDDSADERGDKLRRRVGEEEIRRWRDEAESKYIIDESVQEVETEGYKEAREWELD